jgi:hypothetical protein
MGQTDGLETLIGATLMHGRRISSGLTRVVRLIIGWIQSILHILLVTAVRLWRLIFAVTFQMTTDWKQIIIQVQITGI